MTVINLKAHANYAVEIGTQLSIFESSKNEIEMGNYRAFRGPHMELGSVEVTVIRGGMNLEKVGFRVDPNLIGNFKGRGITTYKVVDYVPGTIFLVTNSRGRGYGDEEKMYFLVAKADEVPPGATMPPKEWDEKYGGILPRLIVGESGEARTLQGGAIGNPQIGAVVMTGLPVA